MEKEKTINVKKMDPALVTVINDTGKAFKVLREFLDKDIRKPFTLDPLLTFEIKYSTPYELNEFIAKYIFNSTKVYIMGIRIINSFIEIELADDKGNTATDRIYLGEKTDTVKFWEYYVISMISWSISIYIEEKKEELWKFLNDLETLRNNAEN